MLEMIGSSPDSPRPTAERAEEATRDEARTWSDHVFKRRGWVVAIGVTALFATLVATRGWPRPTPVQAWFAAPLVLLGVAMRVWARCYLVRGTNTRRVHARRLVESGPYRRLRNPIYFGNVAAATGIALAFCGPLAAALLLVLLGAIYSTVIRSEEAVLQRAFPERYDRLAAAVPRWWPRARLRPAALAADADAPAPQLSAALRCEVQRILGAGAAWAVAFWLANFANHVS